MSVSFFLGRKGQNIRGHNGPVFLYMHRVLQESKPYSILFYSTLKLPSFNLFCRSLSLPCSYVLLCEYYKKGFCQIFSREPHGTVITILFINGEPY
jgi:hypothetical protein